MNLGPFLSANLETVILGLGAAVAILLLLVLYLLFGLSSLKARYRAMMKGNETGADFEQMMLAHIKKTEEVGAANDVLMEKHAALDALLQTALTRVGIIRFSAFQDMGSDLSYAVALLDAHNNGVVFSSIFAREDSRTYVKPIEGGRSRYTLTDEEEQAIRDAIASAR